MTVPRCVGAADTDVAESSRLDAVAKIVLDLDSLIEALCAARGTQPWKRMMREQLEPARLKMQVLRMVISLERPPPELEVVAGDVHQALSFAHTQAMRGRADANSKAALQLANTLSSRLKSLCRAVKV